MQSEAALDFHMRATLPRLCLEKRSDRIKALPDSKNGELASPIERTCSSRPFHGAQVEFSSERRNLEARLGGRMLLGRDLAQ
jgi:hypothetical protein